MTITPNQFEFEAVVGNLDLPFASAVITGAVDSSETTALVAGQAVKIVDSAGGVPKVTALESNIDSPFGFVVRNLKDQNYPASARVEIATQGAVMWMTAGAAIARGAQIEIVNATQKVITNAGTNPIAGYALDKAAADGDLIRVYILTPGFSTAQGTKVAEVEVTLAELNAGKTIIPAVSGKSIRVVDWVAKAAGTFGGLTSADLEDESATKVAVLAAAGLDDATLIPGSANTTLGAGFATTLTAGEALVVSNVGSAATGGTSITFTVTYDVV